MDGVTPALEVGFEINTAGSFSELTRLDGVIDQATANAVAEFAKVERASKGMLNLGPAKAEIAGFGNAVTREAQNAARELARVEKAGEGLSRQLERQNATFGKSKEELRAMRVEAGALAAEQQGLTELATRLRAQEQALYDQEFAAMRRARQEAEAAAEDKAIAAQRAAAAAERESQAVREAAWAHQMFEARVREGARALREMEAAEKAAARANVAALLRAEAEAANKLAREHAALAAVVRGSHAAQEADAVAAERMRATTDPLYAATKRLNDEIAESTRLYQTGATAPAEYARQQEVLTGRLREIMRAHDQVGRANGTIGNSAKLAAHHTQNLAFQFQDLGIQMFAAAGSSAPLKMAFTALIQQGAQIQDIMSQAGIGVWDVAEAFGGMTKAVLLATVTNPLLLGLAGTVGTFAAAVRSMQNAANDGGAVKAYAQSLGLTAEEIKRLDNVTVTFGDTAKAVFQVVGKAIWGEIGPSVTNAWGVMKEWIDWIASGVKSGVNYMIDGFVGAFNVIRGTWGRFPVVMGDIFLSTVNASISAINALVAKAIEGINFLGAQANKILPDFLQIPQLGAPQIDFVKNQYAGAFSDFGKVAKAEFDKSMGVDYLGAFAGAVVGQARQNAFDRVRGQADDKGFLDKDREKAAGLSDLQRQYEALVKAAKEYAAAQLDEAAKVGLSAKQLRLYADAVAREKAPTDELKKAISDAAEVREQAYSKAAATDFQKNIIQPLQDELSLYGLVGPARAAAALQLEKETFLAKNMDDGIAVATARWEEYYKIKRQLIDKDIAAEREAELLKNAAAELDRLVDSARAAGNAIAHAFGNAGNAIADTIDLLAEYAKRQEVIDTMAAKGEINKISAAKQSRDLQLQSYTALTGAAKGFFKEGSSGYRAMAAAEKAFAVVQLANTAINVAAGAAKMFASLGPLGFPAVAAMLGVMASLGFSGGGRSSEAPKSNSGTGTVFGDGEAKSESIKRAIDALKEVDTVMLGYSREMAASLKSIESQIGNLASLVVRAGDINASVGVTEGFRTDALGKALTFSPIGKLLEKVPVIGDIIGGITGVVRSLFGTKTKVVGSGLFGGAQSLESILSGGFDASYYSDIQKKKKLFGLTTSTKYSTQYGEADSGLENQFTLILRQFNDAIAAAAGPLGVATDEVQRRLNGFVVNLGKIDLQGLTGAQIEEKLTAVFGAAADNLANAAFPGFERFQKVGEGAFETLVRVASTVEAVTASFDRLGLSAAGASIDVKVAVADQFDSVSAMTSAVQSYFETYYSKAEQTAANLAQFGKVFDSLGVAMPQSLAAFRALVEAQDLTTAAGQSTYAVLLQLAPAFADLQSSLNGAKSAADVLAERQELERRLLELQGDTAAIRAQDLAKLDASNRALQQQIYAIEDARAAAQAADELRKAWTSVGDGIMDEVKRIRGLTGGNSDGNFAVLMGQFNAATAAARAGDQDAAKTLPGLSQSLLRAAELVATSRQELDRVQGQTAASLEQTYAAIQALAGSASTSTASTLTAAATAAQAASPTASAANDDLTGEVRALREEVERLRADNNAGHAATAGNTGAIKRTMENVTQASGGEAISVTGAAA